MLIRIIAEGISDQANAMNWQWRNSLTCDVISQDRLDAHSSLAIRLGELFHSDILLRLGADCSRERIDREQIDTLTLKAQLEINRW